jgi:hypothetical protein
MRFESPDFHAQLSSESLARNHEYIHPLVAQAAIEAEKVRRAEAIDPKLFVSVYGEHAVARDLKYVQERKRGYSAEDSVAKKWASVLEIIFYQHAELSNWLGENTHTILAAEVDDIANGIDVAVRMNDSDRAFPYLGMGIDVTYGTMKMREKVKNIFQEIDEGQLGKMHYFMDPEFDQFKGELSKIPHLVVGVERNHIIELSRQWLNGEKRALADNPIQLVILQEIMKQLKLLRQYARKTGKKDLVEIYTADIDVFEPVLRDRQTMDIRNYENDRVVNMLSDELNDRAARR